MHKPKTVNAVALAIGLAFSSLSFAGPAPTTSWTNWNQDLTGTLVQNGSSITVTYNGNFYGGVDYGAYIYDVPGSFTNATVTNTPGSNGTIDMAGGERTGGTFFFSSPVINPVMDIFSLGQPGVQASYVFSGIPAGSISLLAGGTGHWGGQSITLVGNTVYGSEGNGLIQFNGTFSSISFATPQVEYYYGATVGALSTAPVPEPETYAMMIVGLGLLGFMAQRRKNQA